MQNLLIADSSQAFISALSQQLKDNFCISSCTDGREALEILLSSKPDFLVLDLMLPGLDGISVLQTAFSNGVRPVVLVTVSIMGYYIDSSLEQLGVVYVVRKPCDAKATALRVIEISQCPHTPVICEPDNRERVEGMLQVLGCQLEQIQYPILLEAVLAFAEDPKQCVTKNLYDSIAKRFGCKSTRIEKAIRDIIKTAWASKDEQVWKVFFPANFNRETPRIPTNAQFIRCLAKMLLNTDKMKQNSPR